MTLKRTFINRGKKAIEKRNLMGRGIYAVRHILPVEVAFEWGANKLEQWGIVMLNEQKKVVRCWNLTKRGEWEDCMIDVDGLELWQSSEMERQFAQDAKVSTEMTRLYETEKIRNGVLSRRAEQMEKALEHYHTNIFHRIAKHFATFFSC